MKRSTCMDTNGLLMANNDNYKIVVPFYVCDVKQPIMSVTRLTEQGFNIQFKDTPTMSHSRGFYSNLVKRSEPLLPSHEVGQHPRQHEVRHQHDRNNRISSNYTSDHHTNRNGGCQKTETTHGHSTHKDFWSEHTGQHVKHSSYQIADVQYQQTDLRTTEEPLSTDKNGTNEDFEDKYQDLNKSQQKRVLQGPTWTGETWFRVKKGTILPGNRPPQPPAVPSQTLKVPAATSTPASSTQQPLTRHTYKRPIEDTPHQYQQTSTPATSIPHPKDVQTNIRLLG